MGGLESHADHSTGTLSDLDLSSDQVARGLATDLSDDSDITVQDSWLHHNTSDDVGGGAFVEILDSTLTFLRVDINGNTSVGSGGGIFLYRILGADARFDIEGGSVSGNEAIQGMAAESR